MLRPVVLRRQPLEGAHQGLLRLRRLREQLPEQRAQAMELLRVPLTLHLQTLVVQRLLLLVVPRPLRLRPLPHR